MELTQKLLKNVADSSAVDLRREERPEDHRRLFVLRQLRLHPARAHAHTHTHTQND